MPKTNNKAKKAKVEKPTHKPLPEHLERGGFALDQIVREGDLAIFKKQHISKPWMKHNAEVGFEVVIIKRHNGYTLGNQYIEPAETYPCNSLWGILGFTCLSRSEAERKFQILKLKLEKKAIDLEAIEVTPGEE